MKKILFILFLFLFIGVGEILAISVYPQEIIFEVYGGEVSCKNVTIFSSGNTLLNDKWTKKNLDTKEMRLHSVGKDDLKLYLDYPKEIFILEKQKIEVCFSGDSLGFYHGVFLAREENSNEGVGIWIKAKIVSNSPKTDRVSLTGMSILENSSSNPSFLLIFSGVLLTIIFFFLIFLIKKR